MSINGAQSVRLEKGTTGLKNYFKQILVPFKFFVDFECNLKCVESYKKYQDHIPFSFVYKLVFKLIVVFRGKNAALLK